MPMPPPESPIGGPFGIALDLSPTQPPVMYPPPLGTPNAGHYGTHGPSQSPSMLCPPQNSYQTPRTPHPPKLFIYNGL